MESRLGQNKDLNDLLKKASRKYIIVPPESWSQRFLKKLRRGKTPIKEIQKLEIKDGDILIIKGVESHLMAEKIKLMIKNKLGVDAGLIMLNKDSDLVAIITGERN